MENSNTAIFEKKDYYFELNKPIYDLSTFVKVIIKSIRDFDIPQPWFRGQSKSSWDLIASINRFGVDGYWKQNELANLFLFKNEGSQSKKVRGSLDYYNIYFMMQHYKFPTRLIDWTESALIALYFAIESYINDYSIETTENASIWILDPFWLNKEAGVGYGPAAFTTSQELDKFANFISKSNKDLVPLPLIPEHPDKRMSFQRSRFTVDGFIQEGHCGFKNYKEHKLYKINISKLAYHGILTELRIMGITHKSVYPDLENISRDILNYPKARKFPLY